MADHVMQQGIAAVTVNGDRYIMNTTDFESALAWQIEGTGTYTFWHRVPGATTWEALLGYPGNSTTPALGGTNAGLFKTDAAAVEVSVLITSGTPTLVVNGAAR